MDRHSAFLAAYLARAGNSAPSADNSQPFQFVWNGESLAVSFSSERGRKGIFGAKSHATSLSLGAATENMESAALAAGFSINRHWNGESGMPYVRLEFVDDGWSGGELPSELPLYQRHTNRFPYEKAPLPDHVLAYLDKFSQGRTRLVSVGNDEIHKKCEVVRCARVSAEARFCNQELHDWLINSLRFSVEDVSRGDGLDIATLNLPPGGSLFMRFIADWRRMSLLNSVGIYKILALSEIQLLNAAPTLVCLVGDESFSGSLDAGALLARVWTRLNAMGLAVHPYYVVTDQLFRLKQGEIDKRLVDRINQVANDIPHLLNLKSGEILHMILRIGSPQVKLPPRSRRLPLNAYFEDRSQ